MVTKLSDKVRKKGSRLFMLGRVRLELDAGRRVYFKVKGDEEEHSVVYDRERNEWSCDCKYWVLHFKWCSHIYAAYLFLKKNKKI